MLPSLMIHALIASAFMRMPFVIYVILATSPLSDNQIVSAFPHD